jgi:type 1 glutamine amidotransferase
VRFSVAHAGPEQVTICFVCELDHAPIEHGKLTFDLASEIWLNMHTDPRVATLANCYLQTYRARLRESAIA